MPDQSSKGIVNRIVHFNGHCPTEWQQKPQAGRNGRISTTIDPIDPHTVVDEAALEAQITGKTGRLAYVRSAIVQNSGPRKLSELIAQRERIWVGHLRLHQRTGYRVSTFRIRDLLVSTIRHLVAHPQQLPIACCAAIIELFARTRGTYRYKVRGELPTIWPPYRRKNTVIRLRAFARQPNA